MRTEKSNNNNSIKKNKQKIYMKKNRNGMVMNAMSGVRFTWLLIRLNSIISY